MDDLISRKALLDELTRIEKLARNRVLDTPSSSPCYNRYAAQLGERTSLKHLVADTATAYDADKVVEKLEQISYEYFDALSFADQRQLELLDAVRIVKGGGIDDR